MLFFLNHIGIYIILGSDTGTVYAILNKTKSFLRSITVDVVIFKIPKFQFLKLINKGIIVVEPSFGMAFKGH
jgi:hypothetical protein